MPFYEYECSQCKYAAEVLQKISDAPLKKCPSCGKGAFKRLISAPVFRLKGSGWYETDFKSDKENKRNLAGTEREETKGAAAGESKAESKDAAKAEAKTEAKPAAAAKGESGTAAAARPARKAAPARGAGAKRAAPRRAPGRARGKR
ncbi:MAG: zinc ribbon domain-containing protein [Steroidobacteraceae bacterium]